MSVRCLCLTFAETGPGCFRYVNDGTAGLRYGVDIRVPAK